MRLMSGFFVLSIWNLSYLLGTLYMQLVPFIFACFVFTELRRIKRNDDKDKSSKINVVEWMIFVFSQIVVLSKGSFRREILENSGFSAERNPILFGFLYEY
jgi:ABC-type Co2+ transport system permease subunit